MKFSTLLDVMMDILHKRKVTAVELAEKYETSTRTIYRYVDELSFSIPVYVKRGRNGGICIADNYRLPVGFLNKEEYQAAIEALDATFSQLPEERFLAAKKKIALSKRNAPHRSCPRWHGEQHSSYRRWNLGRYAKICRQTALR